jgi:hypothetical protein
MGWGSDRRTDVASEVCVWVLVEQVVRAVVSVVSSNVLCKDSCDGVGKDKSDDLPAIDPLLRLCLRFSSRGLSGVVENK